MYWPQQHMKSHNTVAQGTTEWIDPSWLGHRMDDVPGTAKH